MWRLLISCKLSSKYVSPTGGGYDSLYSKSSSIFDIFIKAACSENEGFFFSFIRNHMFQRGQGEELFGFYLDERIK